jgi:hypothetical protein
MEEITTTDAAAARERKGRPLTGEELDQGPDVLANLYALAIEKARAQGLQPPAEWVRRQSARGR